MRGRRRAENIISKHQAVGLAMARKTGKHLPLAELRFAVKIPGLAFISFMQASNARISSSSESYARSVMSGAHCAAGTTFGIRFGPDLSDCD